MAQRYTAPSAVFLLLLREVGERREILLQLRHNTNFADNMWDCAASGHVDAFETMTEAMVREAREELGIEIDPAGLRLATTMHRFLPEGPKTYVNFYFVASDFSGTPVIGEPDKCAELRWFDLERLPEKFLHRQPLANYFDGIFYGESGFDLRPRAAD